MKIHYAHPVYGVTCHTNRTRATSRKARTTPEAPKVTCDACRKQHALDTNGSIFGQVDNNAPDPF